MAMIRCPECKKKISDTCDTCIHCGYKIKSKGSDELDDEEYRMAVLPDDDKPYHAIFKALGIILGAIVAVLAVGFIIFIVATCKQRGPLENEIMATVAIIVFTIGTAAAILCDRLL